MYVKRVSRLLSLLLAPVLALSIWIASPGQPTRAATTRIMPLGDSITGSPGCWRALLWNQLQDAGYTDIDFVGTLPPQGCGVAHDGDNEGHGGYLATNIADQNLLPGWLAATNPDIVIMHLGTNDVWSNRSPATILAAFSKLVDQMRDNNPNMKILVAQIIPLNPSTCPECAQRAVDFNSAIPAWAAGKSTAQSPVTVVDQWTGFDTATDTYDGVHPNSAGDQKMAAQWFPALTAALNGTATVTPATSTSTPRPTTITPTICPQYTIPPLLVEPVTSPTNLLEQEIVVPVYTSGQTTVEVTSESGTFSVVGSFSATNPARVNIPLLPDTTHHLTVKVIVPPWTSNGCSYDGFTMTTTLDRNRNPLTIVQGNAPANACKVDYTVNQWGTGYTADVKITNLGSSPIQGWTLEWRYANGQQITSAWNATVSQSGADVTASNPTTHWNGNIPANGGSVSFGVQGTHSGTNASPVAFMLNGLACNGGTVTPTHTPTATPTRTPTATRTPTVTTCPAVAGYVRLGSNSGAGLPGVKIYRNVNDIVSHYATTDSNGYFIGNGCGVIGMTYWPELAGYTFEPASRTLGEVSIENDFVARPTSIQPDLVITSFYESMIGYEGGGCVNEYNGYEFRVTVMNAGAAPAGSFEVAVEGSIQIVDGLAAGESITLHYPLPLEPSVLPTPSNTPWPGQVVAMADWTNVVAESNETNNSRTSSMATMTPPPLCTRTPTPTTPVASSCQVVYTPNSWNNGFTANIKIVNNGASAVQGWTLAYSYANGQQVTSAWNATVTQSGANVTASNPSSHWNGNIPANGGSVSFGVQGTHSGTNTNPTSFALNGVVCTNP